MYLQLQYQFVLLLRTSPGPEFDGQLVSSGYAGPIDVQVEESEIKVHGLLHHFAHIDRLIRTLAM